MSQCSLKPFVLRECKERRNKTAEKLSAPPKDTGREMNVHKTLKRRP